MAEFDRLHMSSYSSSIATVGIILYQIRRVFVENHEFSIIPPFTEWAKNGLYLRSDNFATTNDRKACNTSKFSEFCLE